MTAETRILRLIRPEYLERIPSFVRGHAIDCSCRMVARRYPELYRLFGQEEEPGAEETKEMAQIVNAFFAQRIRNRHV